MSVFELSTHQHAKPAEAVEACCFPVMLCNSDTSSASKAPGEGTLSCLEWTTDDRQK